MAIVHVPAYMNHGRWVGDCTGPCETGAAVYPGFECDQCRVLGTHTFIAPTLPGDFAEIEEALCIRPEPRTRNWIGETVDKLHQETRDWLWPDKQIGQVKAAAKRAVKADRPRDEKGWIMFEQEWDPQDSALGPPRRPIRTRGRRLYIPPHLPEGWSENGISVGTPKGSN